MLAFQALPPWFLWVAFLKLFFNHVSSPPLNHGLNIAQQEAVNFLHGPCLVLAGAGSGKTRVITHKIGRLIQSGLPADRILAITFTNKAAAEMRERARQLIGPVAKEVLICTFHALGVRILRSHGVALGLKPNFSILDSDDVLSLMKDAGGTTDNNTARGWQWGISLWKNTGLNSTTALAQAKDEHERQLALLMAKYEERLTAYQAVDFDDLIGLPVKLLQTSPEALAHWQAKTGHLLVDEYQDTNVTQYALLKMLVAGPNSQSQAGKPARFTAVGDDDQSIYGWRGATLDNLRQLPIDFPQLKVVKLEQNYRSTSTILTAANNLIAPNPKLFPKNLWSAVGEGEPVRVVDADHEDHEAERVVARIQSLRSNGASGSASAAQPLEWRDFAVLYRANHLAKAFEKALRKANIPYKVSGGTSFFDRAEIKDLCAWFRLLINQNDDPAFLRAVTTPKRGIGAQTLQTLGNFAGKYRVSLFEALFSPSLEGVLGKKALESLHEFGREVNELQYRAKHCVGKAAALALLRTWLTEIGYEKFLFEAEDKPALANARWTNVTDFCDWMAGRCGGEVEDTSGASGFASATAPKNLLEVAQTISLLSTLEERDKDPNQVTLSTLHAAKGLEWPHVMLVGVNEGLLPFSRGSLENGETVEDAQGRLEEERRLMYVGITRAQRTLAVSWTRRRKKGRDLVLSKPSRFIAEMALNVATAKEDPRAKLRALRAEFALKAAANAAVAATATVTANAATV